MIDNEGFWLSVTDLPTLVVKSANEVILLYDIALVSNVAILWIRNFFG